MALAQHKIRVIYEGGLADEHSLPGYDGVTSIDGITRAVHIATHAYMTGEIISRATALRRASIQLKPARQGSFVFDLIVLMEAHPATTGASVALMAPPFYDFLKTAFKRATGFLAAEPENAHLKKLYEQKEPKGSKKLPAELDVLAETLEGTLQDAHRPVGIGSAIQTISIGSPRQKIIVFNNETKDWVNTQEEATRLETLSGNVTRFNSLSRNGRAFIDKFEKVVPMRPDADFDAGDLHHLTWSLHGSNIGAPNKIDMRVRRVTSASGKVKRLLLAGCQRA